MPTMKPLKLLTLLLLFIISENIHATHIMGSDITYEHLGAKKYKVTVKIYRDCRGISLSTINVRVSTNNKCATGIILTIKRTSIKNITAFCPGTKAPCTPSNTYNSGKGVEEHTFEGTIDLADPKYSKWASSGCCEVYFNWSLCCRNGAITTGQQSELFYSYAMLNICNLDSFSKKSNSSPKMSNAPVAYICCNQPYNFNNGCIDSIDTDSLAYSLENPLGRNINDLLSYNSPLNYSIPMTPYCPNGGVTCTPNPNALTPEGFFLDNKNGDVVFTPTNCTEVGVVVIQVKEYRKSPSGTQLLVGVIRRDMQLIVENCKLNNTPVLTGPNDTIICMGESICFDVNTYDKDGDTLKLSWNKGIQGGSFQIKNPNSSNKKAEFCWNPGPNVVKNLAYTFTAKVEDDFCPRSAASIKSFTIKVSDRPPFKIAPVAYLDSCHQNAILNAGNKNNSNLNYSWVMPGGSPGNIAGLNQKGPHVVQYQQQGTHPVYLSIQAPSGLGCILTDTTEVNVFCAILPVHIKDFSAHYSNNSLTQIQLDWLAVQEQHIRAYKAQWSVDNIHFTTGDSIQAIGQQQATHYTSSIAVSNEVNAKGIFVRLLEQDNNGQEKVASETLFLDVNQANLVKIYPVPMHAGDAITISGLTRGSKKISIIDKHGKLVYHSKQKVLDGNIALNQLQLPQGIYTMAIDAMKHKLIIIN